jgi:hypothetical protein
LADYLWIQHKIDTIHLRHRVKNKPLMKIRHSEIFKDRLDLFEQEVLGAWNANPIDTFTANGSDL